MKKLLGLALGALLAWSAAAIAAPIEYKTVTVCNGQAYSVGASGQATGLPTGEICVDIGSTSGGAAPVIGSTTAADGAALTSILKTYSLGGGYNGATIDMLRAGDVNNVASATGYFDGLMIGRYNATLPTLTDTRYNAFQVDSRGALEATPYYTGTPAAVGSGVMTAGVPRMALATDSPGIITTGSPGSASSTVISLQGVVSMTPVQTSLTGAIAITFETATSGLVSNASAVATLAASGGKTTYITGFQCTPGMATAAAAVSIVVSGLITGSNTLTAFATNATTFVPAPTPVIVQYPTPIPASAANTTIVVTMGAVGTGGATAVCNAQGYQQ